MRALRQLRFCCGLGAAAAGCAHPAAPGPPLAAEPPAVEQARREERLKIMQQYWQERTAAPDRSGSRGGAPADLEYPAGSYSGINFGPRSAPDPGLAEPDR